MRILLNAMLLALLVLKSGPVAEAMPIPPQVKQCVAFVFGNIPGGGVAAGTGFFVGVKSTFNPDRFFVYFVTARHVLQIPDGKSFFSEIFIRLNTKVGDAELVRVQLITDGPGRTVFLPEDKTVDLAVIPMLPDQEKFDYRILPDDLIVTQGGFKNLGIAEGSDVFFTGLFMPHIGEKKNYPIVRFGRVAMITPEKILWQKEKIDLYLMETASFGGNSGSPVFFYLGSDRGPGTIIIGAPQLYLAGIMKGTFNEEHPVETAAPSRSIESLGISGVVPAYKLHELLFAPELAGLRD